MSLVLLFPQQPANQEEASITVDGYVPYFAGFYFGEHYIKVTGDSATAVSLTDTVGITDSISSVLSYNRSIADSVDITDAISKVLSADRSITDNVGITDTVTYALVIAVELTDDVGITDVVSGVVTINRSITDSVDITDSVSSVSSISRSVVDNVGITDAITGAFLVEVSLTDTVGITDALEQISRTVGKTVAEVLEAKDLKPKIDIVHTESGAEIHFTADIEDVKPTVYDLKEI